MLRAAAIASLLLTLSGILTGHSTNAAFPGTNGKITFISTRDGNYEIYVMDADGNNQIRLTTNLDTDGGPAWSADGERIAFYRESPNPPNPVNREVYVMNTDGSGQTNLTNSIPMEYDPAWSPEGSKIAYYSAQTGDGEIFVMDANGSHRKNLTNASGSDETYPAWSPDGSEIAYVSDTVGFPFYEIYSMNADGTSQHPITTTPGLYAAPDWSPDGTKIAFNAWVGGYPTPGNDEVFVMNADGSSVQQLTNSAGEDVEPSWSPDGTKIAFHSQRDGNFEVYVMDADGNNQTRLTNNSALDASADWQPVTTDSDSDGLTDAQETVVFGTNLNNPDTDGDGCPDGKEVVFTPNAENVGGKRDPLNSYDYWNPSNDGMVRVDDILAVVRRYYSTGDPTGPQNTIPPPEPAYHPKYDRVLAGPNVWNLGQGNGRVLIDDILNIEKQYFHDCGTGIVKVPP